MLIAIVTHQIWPAAFQPIGGWLISCMSFFILGQGYREWREDNARS